MLSYHSHPPPRTGTRATAPCIFVTSTPLSLAELVPTTTESMSATALTTSLPSVCSSTAAPPPHEEHSNGVQVDAGVRKGYRGADECRGGAFEVVVVAHEEG